MNNVTRVRIVYECSIIGVVLLTFLKGMFPYMGAWWRVALITSLVGLWFSLSYLKRYNYKWGFNYIGNHLYINLLLKVQKWFQNATIIALLIPVFLKDLLYNQYCLVAYILLVGMFLGVKLATYTVEYRPGPAPAGRRGRGRTPGAPARSRRRGRSGAPAGA